MTPIDGALRIDGSTRRLSGDSAEQTIAHLETALRSRAVLDQAKGILMAAYRIDADEAWSLLTRVSQTRNIKVARVARAIVEVASDRPSVTEPDVADVAVQDLLASVRRRPLLDGSTSRHDRLLLAQARDAIAEDRDDSAEQRDRRAEARDTAADSRRPEPPAVRSDREAAAEDRIGAEFDRRSAAGDRAAAAADRAELAGLDADPV